MNRTLSLLSFTILTFSACQADKNLPQQNISTPQQNQKSRITIPSSTKQLLVVITPSWKERKGTIQRLERRGKAWKRVGKLIPIILGRNGLAWGLGLHTVPQNAKYIKKEGDGKAPAGLFHLKNGFGYSAYNINFPYSVYKRTDHCVDDSNSQWYNQIIDSKYTPKDYKSFEHMKLKNHLYRYGIVVDHNPEKIAQAGSCIFMHIDNETGRGTAGCTAMKESKMQMILKWLKEEDEPLLLQLPREEIKKVIF